MLNPLYVSAQIAPTSLSETSLNRFKLVPEFAFIQEQANKLGVKVYLFGGTASAFAHYVRWDLEREAGDTKYQKERFDYDFTNIYRGNQDLDIVVDGTAEQAAQLQQVLKQKFPHFIGNKDTWEVRLLRAQIGDKLPLLDDKDFRNQHTDTNSTGMLALNPDVGGIVFRDLLDWENPNSDFLNDVANAKIKYLFNERHSETSRFKEGKNPPILSAIRYIAKLTQYEVTGRDSDIKTIKRIIKNQDFTKLSSYAKHKAEEFGKKALLNSPDIEYAWNLLEETGLRRKLIEMDGDQTDQQDTLSWWLDKEPLKSFTLGEGKKETAKELGITIVAHETNSFIAYENITRSSKGRVNAFISRQGVNGEMAALGNGFYTAMGEEGARGTNLTIRFKVNPEAREGTDFFKHGDHVLFRNKNALTLIQENLNISVLDFFKLILSGDIQRSDRGLFEKLKRKFDRQRLSENEVSKINKFLMNLEERSNNKTVYNLWFSLSASKNSLPLVQKFITNNDFETLALHVFSKAVWRENHLEVFDEFYNKVINGDLSFLVSDVFNDPFWVNHSHYIERILDSRSVFLLDSLLEHVFKNDVWLTKPNLLEKLIKNKNTSSQSLTTFFYENSDKWSQHPGLFKLLIERRDSESILYPFHKDAWKQRPHLLKLIIDGGKFDKRVAQDALSERGWEHAPELLEQLIDQGNADVAIAKGVFTQRTDWIKNNGLVIKLIKKGTANRYFAEHGFAKNFLDYNGEERKPLPMWIDLLLEDRAASRYIAKTLSYDFSRFENFELLKALLKSTQSDDILIKEFIGNEKFDLKTSSKFLNVIFKRATAHKEVIRYALSKKHHNDKVDMVEFYVENNIFPQEMIQYVLSKPYWGDRSDLINKIILSKKAPAEVIKYILTKKAHQHQNDWFELLFKDGHGAELIETVFLKKPKLLKREWLDIYMSQPVDTEGLRKLFMNSHWGEEPGLMEKLLSKKSTTLESDKLVTVSSGLNAELILSKDHLDTYPELFKTMIKDESELNMIRVLQALGETGKWKNHIDFVKKTISKNLAVAATVQFILHDKYWLDYPEIIKELIVKAEHDYAFIKYVLSKPHWSNHPEFLETILNRGKSDEIIPVFIFSQPEWAKHSHLLETLVERNSARSFYNGLFAHVLKSTTVPANPDLLEKIISTYQEAGNDVLYVLKQDHWQKHIPRFVPYLMQNDNYDTTAAYNIFADYRINTFPNWLLAVFKRNNNRSVEEHIIKEVLPHKHWAKHPEVLKQIIETGKYANLISKLIGTEHWHTNEELVMFLVSRGESDHNLAVHTFSKPYWLNNKPEVIKKFIKEDRAIRGIIQSVLTKENAAKHPDLLMEILVNDDYDESLDKYVFTKDYWVNNLELRAFLNDEELTPESLREKAQKKDFNQWLKSYRSSSPIHNSYSCESLLM